MDIKKQFRSCLIVLPIIVFALLIYPGNKIDTSEENFIKEKRILRDKPSFKEISHGKSSTEYLVILHFAGDNIDYKIGGIDYNFLKNDEFIKNIKSGDTILISRYYKSIHFLSEKDVEYLNYVKAETNRGLSIYFIAYLLIPLIFICAIVQFFQKAPSFVIRNKLYKVRFDIITIIVFILNIIFLTMLLPPFQIIQSGKFVKW